MNSMLDILAAKELATERPKDAERERVQRTAVRAACKCNDRGDSDS
jgi:hypothetical protein